MFATPTNTTSDVIFNQSGVLVENVTDTIVSNDTLYICQGAVDVRADWNPAFSYLWSTGGTNQIETISTSGTYWVEISSNGCTFASDTVHAIVNTVNVDLGNDTTICDNAPLLLDASYPNASYLWHDNSTNSSFQANTTGSYFVAVSVPGCTISDTIAVTFIQPPIVDLGNDTILCANQSLLLDATTPGVTYLWQDNSANATYNINQAGTFWVTVDNGCLASDTIDVSYLPNPTVNLGPDTTICDNGNFLLDATYPNASYLWQDNSINTTFQVNNSGTYFVEVTESGCSSSDTISVTYIQPISVDLGNDTTLCTNQSLLLDVTTLGVTYLWQDNTTNATYNVNQAGMYWVTVDNGCPASDTININYIQNPIVNLGPDTTICDNGSFLLNATYPNASYLWQDNSTNPTFQASISGTYFVEVSESGCSSSDTININYAQPPVAELGPDTTLCAGPTVLLDVSSQGTSFLWSNGTSNSSYSVMQSETVWVEVFQNGCSDIDTIEITFLPTPFVNLGPDVNFCDVLSISLDATASNVTYQWQDGSINPTFTATTSGTYWVTLSNGVCEFTDSVDISLGTTPIIDLGNDTTLCFGATITLDVSGSGITYEWQDGSQGPSIDLAGAGLYWVEVSNGNCTAIDSIVIDYISAPSINLSDTTICQGNSFFFDVTIPNGTYEWNDGSTAPIFLVQQDGVYSVDVTNNCGTVTSSAIVQEAFCFCEIYVPNSFTPDTDERNNTFGAISDCPLDKYEILIFNRWGEVIFESKDINSWWDATYKGRYVQDGIYTWKITFDYVDEKDDPQTMIGHVIVIR